MTARNIDWNSVLTNDQALIIPKNLQAEVASIVRSHTNTHTFTLTHVDGRVFTIFTLNALTAAESASMYLDRAERAEFIATFGEWANCWKLDYNNHTTADLIYNAIVTSPRFEFQVQTAA